MASNPVMPYFLFCENKSALPGAGLILYTKPPYWVGQVIKFKTHEECMNYQRNSKAMAGGKLLEYCILVIHAGQLEPVRVAAIDADQLAEVYRRMCDFYLEEKILPNQRYYERYKQ